MEKFEEEIIEFINALDNSFTTDDLIYPTYNRAYPKIIKILNKPNPTIRQLIKIIQTEPFLLLKTYGLIHRKNPSIKVINNKVIAKELKAKDLSCIIYSIVLEQYDNEVNNTVIKDSCRKIIDHSIDIGCWAYCLSNEFNISDPEFCMGVTMLNNLGQFYLLNKIAKNKLILKNDHLIFEILRNFNRKYLRKIIDAANLPVEISLAYNPPISKHPDFPPKTIRDIIVLSTILSDVECPHLESLEITRKKDFYAYLNEEESKQYEELRKSLYDHKCDIYDLQTLGY